MRERVILFIDDAMVAEQAGLHRVAETATKFRGNPVVSTTYPWEAARTYIFGSVIREPGTGLFRMWYQAADRQDSRSPGHFTICYAESNDGVEWHKPLLDVSGYRDRKATNIVLGHQVYPGNPYCASVIRDEDAEDPMERYKMTAWLERWTDGLASFDGAAAFHSPDGLHWLPYDAATPYVGANVRVEEGNVERLPGPNDVNCISPNKLDGNYVSWQVVRQYLRPGKRAFQRDLIARDRLERVMAMQVSSNFVNWSDPQMILEPTLEDPDHLQFYGMGGFRYGQYWLGTLWTYHVHDQSMDLELALSRDGRVWTRPFPGHRLVRLGEDGEFDCGMILSASAPVVVGDRLHIYYGGHDARHDEPSAAAIGLATLLLDRWAGLRAGTRGTLVTKPFVLNGSELTLNAYARGGDVRCELLVGGSALPGYTIDECVPVVGDRTRHSLQWQQGGILSSLKGRQISVRLEMRNATVYGIEVS